ncbi:MAG: type I 3-dehydroquinate dehydratase, partial [Acidobacteriota bacterium]
MIRHLLAGCLSGSQCYPPAMDWIVSLTPEAAADPTAAIADPPHGATIVELRVDRFPGINIQSAVTSCPLPVLATLRSQAEGGEGPNDPAARSEILATARDSGAALLDLEFERDAPLIRTLGLAPEQTVVSWHDPSGTPDGLTQITERMIENSARWIKVVPSANSMRDLVSVLELHRRFNGGPHGNRRLITFAMGGSGAASRYLAPLFGPPIGFAAWNDEGPAAPGQITIDQTEAVISHLHGPPQRMYGVVGADVAGSLSPVLHSAGYRSLDLPYLLLPISVPDAAETLELFGPRGSTPFDRVGLEPWGWAVTTPFKADAAAAADRHAPRVLRSGAANTLILGELDVIAENTDADGVVGSLVALGIDPRGRKVVVQGTGGAARGAAIGVYLAGADVSLRGRSSEKTRETAEMMEIGWLESTESCPDSAILVNATPVGHHPDEEGPFT